MSLQTVMQRGMLSVLVVLGGPLYAEQPGRHSFTVSEKESATGKPTHGEVNKNRANSASEHTNAAAKYNVQEVGRVCVLHGVVSREQVGQGAGKRAIA